MNFSQSTREKDNAKKGASMKPFFFQPKLSINQPNDVYEQEADHMADKVMRMTDVSINQNAFFKPAAGYLQRKCKACGEEEEDNLHRKETNIADVQGSNDLDGYVNSLGSSGQPLPEADRKFFEPKFGRDFSSVRLHTDTVAAKSAASINALAYTSGNNIVFKHGQYAPGSDSGQRLMAHELTHVLQQDNNNTIRRKMCSATRACCEADKCATPDTASAGTLPASTWWAMDVNIDIEESDWQTAARTQHFGHTFIRFYESNGTQYTYGFYPGTEIPSEKKTYVEGCINHPDTAHDACTDRTETFFLKIEQYKAGLDNAQNMCKTRHWYGYAPGSGSYTCTTFASEVVTAAGHHLPSSASKPTTIYYQDVPAIDNPNTLNENMAANNEGIGSDEKEILTRVEMYGPAMLDHYSWQEKVRWISVLLDENWITDRDVAAVVKICCVGTNASDLANINTKVTPLLSGMHSSDQETKVKGALAGSCPK